MKPPSWSYSALSTYENCPKQYLEVNIKKSTKKSNYAATDGAKKHKEIESYLVDGTPMSPAVAKFTKIIDHFRDMPGDLYVEHQMALDITYKPVEYKDWTNAWVRSVADVLVVNGDRAIHADWKFGKPRDGDDQVRLGSAVVMAHFPQVNVVENVYVYLEHKMTSPTYTYRRDQIPEVWRGFGLRYSAIIKSLEETKWPARPSGLCGYCPVDTCEYNRGMK